MTLRVGFPSKGRIADRAIEWFGSVGLRIEREDSLRSYSARVFGIDGIEPVMLPPSDIASELANGSIHIGLTGLDMVREALPENRHDVQELVRLGFSRARLLIAVPQFWVDAHDIDDLDEIAGQFRERHGVRLRIATKYRNLTRDFLCRKGIADYRLVDSGGATEGAIVNGIAEAISDISSTGRTLHENGLKPLSDAVILQSEATLFRSMTANLTHDANIALSELIERISAAQNQKD